MISRTHERIAGAWATTVASVAFLGIAGCDRSNETANPASRPAVNAVQDAVKLDVEPAREKSQPRPQLTPGDWLRCSADDCSRQSGGFRLLPDGRSEKLGPAWGRGALLDYCLLGHDGTWERLPDASIRVVVDYPLTNGKVETSTVVMRPFDGQENADLTELERRFRYISAKDSRFRGRCKPNGAPCESKGECFFGECANGRCDYSRHLPQ